LAPVTGKGKTPEEAEAEKGARRSQKKRRIILQEAEERVSCEAHGGEKKWFPVVKRLAEGELWGEEKAELLKGIRENGE